MFSKEVQARLNRYARMAKARAEADNPDRSRPRSPYRKFLVAALGVVLLFFAALILFFLLAELGTLGD
jgi:hypothetical protein